MDEISMFTEKKKNWRNTPLTFLYPISAVKEDLSPQTQHTQHFKHHSVNSCAYLAFLFFPISQRERFSINKKLMGYCFCRALFCAGWTLTCQWFRLGMLEMKMRVSSWQHSKANPFLKTAGTLPRETVAPPEPWRTVFPIQVYFPCLTLCGNQWCYTEND